MSDSRNPYVKTDAYSGDMERVSVRMPREMVAEIERHVDNTDAPNRSEVIRECVRRTDISTIGDA